MLLRKHSLAYLENKTTFLFFFFNTPGLFYWKSLVGSDDQNRTFSMNSDFHSAGLKSANAKASPNYSVHVWKTLLHTQGRKFDHFSTLPYKLWGPLKAIPEGPPAFGWSPSACMGAATGTGEKISPLSTSRSNLVILGMLAKVYRGS